MKNDRVYLQHIIESMDYIASYVVSGKDEFMNTRLIQDAVIRNLEIIGEATKNLSKNIRTEFNDIPWREMAGLRDVLIHDYFGVDLFTVWGVVEKELPRLRKEVAKIMDDYKD